MYYREVIRKNVNGGLSVTKLVRAWLFLSWCHQDVEAKEALLGLLHLEGLAGVCISWWADSHLLLGEDWRRRIEEFGRQADTPDLRRRRVRLEDKGAILAFHWRGAPDQEAARAAIDAIATKAQDSGLRTHWGRMVLEVRPPVRIDKGAGIAAFLDTVDVDVATYVGDDVTDETAFARLRPGDVGVKVGEGKTAAAYRVGTPDDVTQLLVGHRRSLGLAARSASSLA